MKIVVKMTLKLMKSGRVIPRDNKIINIYQDTEEDVSRRVIERE